MIGFEIYQKYIGVKLHFNTQSFDFTKSKGTRGATLANYNKRRDRFFFEKMSTKLQTVDIIPFFVAQFINCNTTWIGEMLDNFEGSLRIYRTWKGERVSIKENIRTDMGHIIDFLSKNNMKISELFHVNQGITHPIILRFYLEEMISIETMIYLDLVYKYIEPMKLALDDPVSEHHMLIMQKYQSFLKMSNKIVDINSLI